MIVCRKVQDLMMVDSPDEMMDVQTTEQSNELPLSLDRLYNLIVCNHCGMALPSEWVHSHLKEQHGIETTDEQVSQVLGLEDNALTVQQVKDWRESVWVGKAVQKIPVVKGHRCNLCDYSDAAKKGMKNHFTEIHKKFKRARYSEECKVQLVFNGRLRKYIQVEEDEDMDVDVDEGGDQTITGLPSGEVSVRKALVLFCVQKRGPFKSHSGEGPPIAERVKTART